MSLKWVDEKIDDNDDGSRLVIKQEGKQTCKTCGREQEFKHIYYDHCRSCVALAHRH